MVGPCVARPTPRTLLSKEKEQIIDTHSSLVTLWRSMLREKGNPERLHTQDPTHVTFVKLQNCRHRGQINGCQGLWGRETGGVGWQQKEGSWGDGDALYLQCLHPGSDTVLEFYKIEPWGKPAMCMWGSLYYFLQLLCVIYTEIQSLTKRAEGGEKGKKEAGEKREERERQREVTGALGRRHLASGLHPAQDSPFPPLRSLPVSSEVTRTQAKEQFPQPQAILITLCYSGPTLAQQHI